MNTKQTMFATAFFIASGALAQSNIDPDHKFAWQENIGWLNWRDASAANNGVEVFDDHLSGWIWAENAGWITVGPGAGPYTNDFGSEHGVNILPGGYLAGFAWSENLGWINFGTEPFVGADGARFDESELRFRGWAWAENAGWVNLDDATHYVAVLEAPCPTDLTGDGQVNGADLAFLLGAWGPVGAGHPADYNGDHFVSGFDLAQLLGSWGPCG